MKTARGEGEGQKGTNRAGENHGQGIQVNIQSSENIMNHGQGVQVNIQSSEI